MWRSHITDAVPEQNHAPALSLSRVRRAMQLEHQRSRMCHPDWPRKRHLSTVTWAICSAIETVTPPPDAITSEVIPLSDHADAELLP